MTIEKSAEDPPSDRIDKITGNPLAGKLTLLKVRIQHGEGPFFQIFLAAEADNINETTEQICRGIDIPQENVIQIDFPTDSMDINSILLSLLELIRQLHGDRAAIVVKGIEKRGKFVQNQNLGKPEAKIAIDRVMHDYSQEIFDSASGQRLQAAYRDSGKKVIIITQICRDEGDEIYEAMLRSALQTRFKTDVLEI